MTLFLLFSGLLLAALIAAVTGFKPIKTPEQQSGWLRKHQAVENYLAGEKIIEKLLPSPALWWSPASLCGEVGRGIWLVQGTVGVESSAGQETPLPWTAIFIPETSQPLYFRLGSREVGNLATALAQAGVQVKKP